MRFAYADPPYLGCCRLYDHKHGDGGCWDELDTHAQLVERLVGEFPDGWALSASTPSLRHILPLTPESTRVAGWMKTFCVFKKGVRPCYGWEPVLFFGGRNPPEHKHAPPEKGGKQVTPKDFVITEQAIAEPITLKKGLTGAKPEKVCQWILDLLGYREGDEIVDLYPGTGVMGRVAA
jgi:hypothetical protein